jgi:trafficking protein particle complex subunit 10
LWRSSPLLEPQHKPATLDDLLKLKTTIHERSTVDFKCHYDARAMENAASIQIAKVAIEYHDPSGVFELIEDQLCSRLPLRNLHWKNPKRPLRSIESLHVELIKSVATSSSGGDGSRPSSRHSQSVPDTAPAKERRHQIPGLRQTPYLKLYLLRCDDPETYKSVQRKAVRDWLKTHTPASQSSSSKKNAQENHDAFDWMIIHVVLPNTPAANEPIHGVSGGKTEGPDRSSKFLNRSSGTLLEKLRSDFNVSSKSAPDRISQIRLNQNQVIIGSKPSQSPGPETQDQREAWDDAISKIKALILASFDLRVSQYEEDIQERESQRSLPGWNFCTFFVLKEGLARGFESVGLVDDALALYEGLNIELDGVLESKDTAGPTSLFLDHTPELKELLETARAETGSNHTLTAINGNLLISSTKKNFRELIMANNVSVFDFKTYVLARKMAVLLRMSRASKETENLIPLGQLCQLASYEIPVLSRSLRLELTEVASKTPSDLDNVLIDNIVASWIYTVCQQILDETSSAFLAGSTPSELQFTSLFKERSIYPARKSSMNTPSALERSTDNAQALFEKLKSRALSTEGAQNKSGKDFLAMQRAMLVAMQRRVLEDLVPGQGYRVGWTGLNKELEMTEVSLSEEDEEEEEEEEEEGNQEKEVLVRDTNQETVAGIFDQALFNALASLSNAREAYTKLTEDALDLYFIAGQGKSFERMLADLAILKFQSKDYAGAANFFTKIIPVYTQLQWNALELEMLMMHAKCLKYLNRRDDYVRMLLSLLAKSADDEISFKPSNSALATSRNDIEDQTIDGHGLVTELFSWSSKLPYEVTVEMAPYFQHIQVEPFVRHFDDKEGFQLRLKFRSSMNEQFKINRVVVDLESVNESSVRKIILSSDDTYTISKGSISMFIGANVSLNHKISCEYY